MRFTEQIHDRRQRDLLWPGTKERCPKCAGKGHVHVRSVRSRGPCLVEGGKRLPCPACGGRRTVRVPVLCREPAGTVGGGLTGVLVIILWMLVRIAPKTVR